MKKKTICLWTALLCLSLLLCGCGGEEGESAVTTVVSQSEDGQSAAVPPMNTAAPNANAPAAASQTEGTDADALRKQAEALVGCPVEELYEAIGEPVRADYASSCLGPGEDGELVYDGFVVYSYRENGEETVHSVS